MKGGLGTAAIQIDNLQVGAIVAVNACGNIVDYKTNEQLAGIYDSEHQQYHSCRRGDFSTN